MKSLVVKRSSVIGSRKTSVSLEDAFWRGLRDIAANRRVALRDLVGSIGRNANKAISRSAIRLFVLDYYQKSAALPNRSFMAADHHHAAH
jgi:predicted DNA-binding ribbon-helix-helix protein